MNERVLDTPNNPISIGLTLAGLQQAPATCPPPAATRADGSSHPDTAGATPVSESSRPATVSAASAIEDSSTPGDCESTDSTKRINGTGCTASEAGQQGSEALECDQSLVQQTARRNKPVTFLGSMLFRRAVSGTRVVARGKEQTVAGHCFKGYGAHCDAYPSDYLTFAAALGTTERDVDEFIRRLGLCIKEYQK